MTSIIFVHYAMNEARARLAQESLESLLKSIENSEAEVIVIDNGGDMDNSDYFLSKAREKKIAHYVRNADNLHFGYARNQGASLALGEYFCFVDNDIFFEERWLEKCIYVLERSENKLVTPMEVDRFHIQEKYNRGVLTIEGVEVRLNVFAGSNCWVMKREDFFKIGYFPNHSIAGTKWCQRYARMGYSVAVLPQSKASCLGVNGSPYAGYNKRVDMDFTKTLSNGSKKEFSYENFYNHIGIQSN